MSGPIEAMVDNETWGIRTTLVVRSVGIVVFDGVTVLDKHYFRIDEMEQEVVRHVGPGGETWLQPRTKDRSTVQWWHQPENADAQATITQAPLVSWAEGRLICESIGRRVDAIWAKPGMFDLPMLRDLFGQDIWQYWKERDMQTLLGEFDPQRTTKPPFEGTPHVAIDDAVHAHTWLMALREKIKMQTYVATPTVGGKIWSCKIGEVSQNVVPDGADFPMRRAVEAAYRQITGVEPDFIFSGWGGHLDDAERAVVHSKIVRSELPKPYPSTQGSLAPGEGDWP